MKIRAVAQFILIGTAVGVLTPFFLSLCLFGTTFQTFMAGPQPTPGYWSGAPTAAPTAAPNSVQVWTNTTLTSSGGVGFVLWSMLGAFLGEAVAVRRSAQDLHPTRNLWLGALAGSGIVIAITLCGGLIR
ncbi:MAG TPA: hypothetical protein VMJ64_04975 [Anaerolineales bacterium]|nr:hypothetical protein [Anaerolineales bacterium]